MKNIPGLVPEAMKEKVELLRPIAGALVGRLFDSLADQINELEIIPEDLPLLLTISLMEMAYAQGRTLKLLYNGVTDPRQFHAVLGMRLMQGIESADLVPESGTMQ